ncbi:MAG: hypothetical protein J2P30_00360 [Actinobacteria bacterium]|nr:hypothetical protein [Actinomycetota bacterium]
MTSDEVWDLLEIIASIDRRKLGLTDRQVWERLVGDLAFGDAQAAVEAYYREHREWIMPSDVRERVKAIRQARLDAAGPTDIPAELASRPIEAREWLQRVRDAIADGEEPQKAIGRAQ